MTKKILAAVDFSELTGPLLEHAAELARALSAQLWLVHAAAPEPDFVGYDPGPVGVRQQVATHLRENHRRLQDHADALRRRGLDVTALLVQGPTVETILREAEKLEVDLLLLGSHGRGALSRVLLGSVSEGVLRRARIPVMILPAAMAGS